MLQIPVAIQSSCATGLCNSQCQCFCQTEFPCTIPRCTTPVIPPSILIPALRETVAVQSLAPISFVNPRWQLLVFTDCVIGRRYHEFCARSEQKNSRRSGNNWDGGSRQFRNLHDYLNTKAAFEKQSRKEMLSIVINTNGHKGGILFIETALSVASAVDPDHRKDSTACSRKCSNQG